MALAALVPLGLARPGPAAALAPAAPAVPAPTARPPVAHRVEPGDGTTPLAAALFVRDGQVRVYCPTGEMDVRPGIVQPVVAVGSRRAMALACASCLILAVAVLARQQHSTSARPTEPAAEVTPLAPPGDLPALGAALYAGDGGPRVVCVTSETFATPTNGNPTGDQILWTAALDAGGPASDWRPGPPMRSWTYGWDAGQFCMLARDGETALFADAWGETCWVEVHLLGDAGEERHGLGFPGFGSLGRRELRLPGDCIAEGARSPSGLLVGDEVWLVTQYWSSSSYVSHGPWGTWKAEDWSPVHRFGEGLRPDIAWAENVGFFVSTVGLSPSSGQHTGPVLLARSPDGDEWDDPRELPLERHARFAAVAADPDVGLVLVYAADGEDGWPLMAVRSTDFGETWGSSVALTAPGALTHNPDALLHGGTLYISYRTLNASAPSYAGYPSWAGVEAVYTMTLDPNDLPVE